MTFFHKVDHSVPSYFRQYGLRSFWLIQKRKRIGACCVKHHATFSTDKYAFSKRAYGTLYITSTAVLPQFRQHGFGAVLKAWQIAYARTHGFTKIVTNIRVSNTASIRLNLKFGFTIVDQFEKCYPDGENAVIMELDLTPST